MNRLLLVVGTACLLVVALGVIGWEVSAEGDGEEEEEEAQEFRNHDDRLVDIATIVPGFGGMYINTDNPNVLNVFLLDPDDEEQLAEVERAISEEFPNAIPLGGIVAAQGDYDIAQLKVWYDDVIAALVQSELRGNLVATDLGEHNNQLEIRVDDEDVIPQVEDLVEGVGVPLGVVNVTIGKRFRFRSGPELSNHTVRDRFRPNIGGIQTRGHNQGICTQAFNAIRSGVHGVIVNSHCTASFASMDSTVFYQPSQNSNNRIGNETVDGSTFRWTRSVGQDRGGIKRESRCSCQ